MTAGVFQKLRDACLADKSWSQGGAGSVAPQCLLSLNVLALVLPGNWLIRKACPAKDKNTSRECDVHFSTVRPFEEITVECSEPWGEGDLRYVVEWMEAVLEVSTLGIYIFSRVEQCLSRG